MMKEDSEDTGEPSSSNGGASARPATATVNVIRINSSANTEDADRQKETASPFSFIKNLIKGKSDASLRDALQEFVEDSEPENKSPEGHERTLIGNILAMRDMRVVDVMIPRADIVALDITTSPQELLALLSERQFSRFPVYRESLDDVIGTIHIKDILACLARGEVIDIETLVRDVPIISPAMHVLDLLLEMKETRRHMGLVVDEFGGIDGLVTIGDIIKAIVGGMEDEHESEDQPQMSLAPDGTIIADGRVSIGEFEARFGQFMSDEEREDIDTLGGLVFAIAGRVPSHGEVLSHNSGLVFEILDADARRVNRLRIKNIPKEDLLD